MSLAVSYFLKLKDFTFDTPILRINAVVFENPLGERDIVLRYNIIFLCL